LGVHGKDDEVQEFGFFDCYGHIPLVDCDGRNLLSPPVEEAAAEHLMVD